MEDTVNSANEIMYALKIIRDVCKKNERCILCPLFSDEMGMCNIKHLDPEKWSIVSNYMWRAFK